MGGLSAPSHRYGLEPTGRVLPITVGVEHYTVREFGRSRSMAKVDVVESLTSGFIKGIRESDKVEITIRLVGEGVDKDFGVRIGAAALPHPHVRPGDKWMRKIATNVNLHTVRPSTMFILENTSTPRTLDVESVDSDSFTAIWREKGSPDRRVRFPLALVAASDRELVQVGAILYWSSGIKTGADGQPQSVNLLRFRRMVEMPREVWDEAEAKAMDWFKGEGVITKDDLTSFRKTGDRDSHR